jgi:hypothetical protein
MGIVNKFLYDMIHMTKGEKFINYWWLWLISMVIGTVIIYFKDKRL